MRRRDFLKAGILLVPFLSGCAGPMKYDSSKYGAIRRLGIIAFSSQDVGFKVNISQDSNMYAAMGANDSMARRLRTILDSHVEGFHMQMRKAITESLRHRNIESVEIEPPRTVEGKFSVNYSNIKEPVLLECKVNLGFTRVKDGIMPMAEAFSKLCTPDGEVRYEKHISIGIGTSWDAEIVGLPAERYETERYIEEHSAEVSSVLMSFAAPLGMAVANILTMNS